MRAGESPPTAALDLHRSMITAIGWYLLYLAAMNLGWEIAQLPLYTLWREENTGFITMAVIHCTGGDVLIGAGALAVALVLWRPRGWPFSGFGAVAALTTAGGVTYTVFSEWWNTEVRQSWAYSELMPVVPGLGPMLSPLLQWVLLPTLGLLLARRTLHRRNLLRDVAS